ncbi:hypothetical protein PQR66_39915 [Paraburkholderia agricolaris]|uniref:Uncharacterized protein n=1 Tax=Paraburkholderia agricolaris TaxID=2152888 RepID=A0ABW9A2H1_9BURK
MIHRSPIMQFRFVLALAVVVGGVSSLTACSDKSAPNEENFIAAVNQNLASSPQRCVAAVSWPASAEPTDHGNPYAFYDAGVGFVGAGLATVKEAGPNASTNFRKTAIFSLTDKGKKILVREPFQPYPNGSGANRKAGGEVTYMKDNLSSGQDRIPYGGRSGLLETEFPEIELTLANAMRQFDT